MNKKILITGASGYVGSRIYQDLKKENYQVVGLYNTTKLFDDLIQADITNKEEVKKIFDIENPNIVIHLAANAHSRPCEEAPEQAHLLNVEATKHIAEIAKEKNIRVIYISTFACYNPSNVYGKTKHEAEEIIKELKDYIIIRLSLVVGLSPNTQNHNFFNDLLKALKSKQAMEADMSWEFEMSSLNHLSEIIRKIIGRDDINRVTIPLVERGVTSRYKIAKKILEKFNIEVKEVNQNRVIPIPDFDESICAKLNLSSKSYDESIEQVIKELEQQNY